jgi:hypothetical protein
MGIFCERCGGRHTIPGGEPISVVAFLDAITKVHRHYKVPAEPPCSQSTPR